MDISSAFHTGISAVLSRMFNNYPPVSSDNTPLNNKEFLALKGIDTVMLSQEGQYLSQTNSSKETNPASIASDNARQNLDNFEVEKLRQLKQRDGEVRIHEQAHLATAGQYSRGGASFTYQKGPDGLTYAVGGEVEIDMSKEKTPEETIKKMQTIKRAALAPASPSAADRSIASKASALEAEARYEVVLQTQEELRHLVPLRNSVTRQEPVKEDQAKVNIYFSNSYSKR
jgi:hypothetical protein